MWVSGLIVFLLVSIQNASASYTLIGANGIPYSSSKKGSFGGHKGKKIFGKLDCPSALRYIAKGYYVKHRVFFASKQGAFSTGYRPCGICMKTEYQAWKAAKKIKSE